MRRTGIIAGLAACLLLLALSHDSQAQRRGGGGMARGRMGPAAAPVTRSYGTMGPQGGVGTQTRTTVPVVGHAGGTGQAGKTSGTHTTAGGATIQYAGAGAKGVTGGGTAVGRGAGAVKVTTASGQTATKAGRAGAAVGPGGNAVGGRSGVAYGSGPGGSFSTAYKGGVAIGPHGAAAGGTRTGAATNVHGQTVSGSAHAGVAVGPYGAAAHGSRAVTTSTGTYYRSSASYHSQALAVRQNFHDFAHEYPVLTARWVGPTWRPIAWSALAGTGGYPAESTSYDYGSSVTYQDDAVCVDGEPVGTPEQYAQQATDIATAGKAAMPETKPEEWQPLGVFAMVQGEETESSNIFQLAVNKDGVIRGEYYNALTDSTAPVYGSVDKKTQRAAWTVADSKTPVYEAGIVNLTKDEASMLVHYGKDKRQQVTLVRIPEPKDEKAAPKDGK